MLRSYQPSKPVEADRETPVDTIIITAANAKYFELVRGTILSVRQKPQGRKAIVGFFDLGCTPEQLQWLHDRVNIIKQPDWEFDFPARNEAPHHFKGLLARPFLRRYFPNFDIYLWIDADAWVQDWKAVELFMEAAKGERLAIVPEINRSSEIQYGGLPLYWWQWVHNQYLAAFGKEVAEELYSYPLLNAGVFALHKNAPHWEVWAEFLERGLQQNVSLMTDQFALNLAVYKGGLFDRTEMLPTWCNWTCHYGFPTWDKQKSCLVEPYLPHVPIGILHLTGVDKEGQVELKTTDRDAIEMKIRYEDVSDSIELESVNPVAASGKQQIGQIFSDRTLETSTLPSWDYISPGFKIIQPDRYFPHKIEGDTSGCPWPYLRREIPHKWYIDERYPKVGFVSRDEAHILYNTALKFQGKNALEIGCWLGWSACHLALAGVELDIIDPILEKPEFYESVSSSLAAAGVIDSVRLIPGYSPEKVEELATQLQKKWSLIFIDGDHEDEGPLNDAIVCEKLAPEDALILFHDLASPYVAQGLDYLKQRGWNTMIYQTMQIMGVAWRGNVEPLIHQPDPNIEWHLPAHLQHHPVSGNYTNQRVEKKDYSWERLINLIEKIRTEPIVTNVTAFDRSQAAQLNQQGKEFFIQGNFERSIQAFENAVKLNSSSWIANKYLTWLNWEREDLEASLRHYRLAQWGHTVITDKENEEFQKLLSVIRPYTLLSESRLFSLYTLAKQICLDDIPGDFVECGTCRGGSAALLAFAIKRYSLRPRLLYGFDTFEGMPEPSDVDKHNGIAANDTGLGVGALKAPISEGLDLVCRALDVTDIVVPVQGLFSDTLPQYKSKIGDIAFLHADGDWYSSTMDVFNNLFPQVVNDGIIQIDNYGFWEGCRKAIHEFERSQGMAFPLRQIDDTGVWFRKQNTGDYDVWRAVWVLAEAAEKMGDVALAEKAALATLKLVPRLVEAEEMLTRLNIPSLKKLLNLRKINLILFPDWNQPEELLMPEIKSVIKSLINEPERSKITLLVKTGDFDKESAEMSILGAVMEILYQEDLDVSEHPEISFIGKLSQPQWQALRKEITNKITIKNENNQAIEEAGMINLPIWKIAT